MRRWLRDVVRNAGVADSSFAVDPDHDDEGCPGLTDSRRTEGGPGHALATHAADPKGIRGDARWRRRESNPCEGFRQKREKTRTYPPNPRNRLDKSLPFDPAPSRLVPYFGAESGHKEGTKYFAAAYPGGDPLG